MLTDRDEMSNRYRGHFIDAYYQVSVHLAKRFQRRRITCEMLTDDGRQVMAKAHLVKGKVSLKNRDTCVYLLQMQFFFLF